MPIGETQQYYDPVGPLGGGPTPTGDAYRAGTAGQQKWYNTGIVGRTGRQLWKDQWGNTKWVDVAAAEPTPTPEPTPEPIPEPTPGLPWEPPRYEFPGAPTTVGAVPQHDWIAEAQRIAQLKQVQEVMGLLETGLAPIQTTLEQLLAMSPEAVEQRFQAEVGAPASRYFEEQTLPHLRRGFVGPGTYWSSMRAGAEQRAGETFREALMGQRSRMFEEQRQTALSASERAMQLQQQAFTGRLYPFETALQAAPFGVQQRGQDLQRQLAEAQMGFEEWLQTEQMRQKERETWGYASPETYATAGAAGAYSPYWPVQPPAETAGYSLGAAL